MKKRAIAIFLLSAVAMTACGDLSLPGSGSGEEASVASKDDAATEETKDETKEETTSEGESKDQTEDENADVPSGLEMMAAFMKMEVAELHTLVHGNTILTHRL